jgi:hypothetical protein
MDGILRINFLRFASGLSELSQEVMNVRKGWEADIPQSGFHLNSKTPHTKKSAPPPPIMMNVIRMSAGLAGSVL